MSEDKLRTCFVISPIGEAGSAEREHADSVLHEIIEPAMAQCHVAAVRSDAISEPGTITSQMFTRILTDDMCVVLLTGQNPNVYYELAVAHAGKRPVIALLQRGERLPFNIQGLRCVEYDLTDETAMFGRAFASELVRHVQSIQAAGWTAEGPLDLSRYTAKAMFFEAFIDEPLVFVLSPKDIDPVLHGTSIHTFMGTMELYESLTKQGHRPSRETADHMGPSSKRQHLVVIGGPIPNKMTGYLLSQPELAYEFGGEDGHSIVRRGDSSFAITPVRNGDTVLRDYGILTRMKNPYDRSKDAIIACGSFGWGTQAALRVLSDGESLERLALAGRHFQLICTCVVDDDGVGTDTQVLDWCEDPKLVQQTIVPLYGRAER
jgi:hypothetical protein